MKRFTSALALYAGMHVCNVLANAEPARFWISTSNSQITDFEAPTLQIPNGSTQTIYVWGQPGVSLLGATSLESISFDLVTKDSPVGAFFRSGITVYNNPQRFEHTIDSTHGFPQNSNDDVYVDDLTTMSSNLTLGMNNAGIHGVAGYSILDNSLNGIGLTANQPCDMTTLCAMTSKGPAWLVAAVAFQANQSSGMSKYHLQIGYSGMKYHDPTLSETDPRENAKVIFGTDVSSEQVTYDAGLCNIDGICTQRQLTYENDTPDLTIQAVAPPSADFSGDGFVGPEDYWMWKQSLGQPQNPAGHRADGNANGIIDAADYVFWRDRQSVFAGDYDRNGIVGQQDFNQWRSAFGQTVTQIGSGADGNGTGVIDAADYVMWRKFLTSIPGDYNRNNVVGPDDYAYWRAAFGQTVGPGSGADGNGNSILDAADYVVWRKHSSVSLGSTLASSTASGGRSIVPEPAATMFISVLPLLLCFRTRAIARCHSHPSFVLANLHLSEPECRLDVQIQR